MDLYIQLRKCLTVTASQNLNQYTLTEIRVTFDRSFVTCLFAHGFLVKMGFLVVLIGLIVSDLMSEMLVLREGLFMRGL